MIRQLVGVAGYVALFAVLLLLPAGTLHWRAAWVLLGVLFAARLASTLLLWRSQRNLLEARAHFPLRRDQALADRLLLPLFMASFAAQVAFCSWDRWHGHLLPTPPPALRVGGLLAFVLGWGVVHLALRANAFAETTVRLQEDRGQRVITDGAYAVVRHPMYSGLLLIMAGLALWLGSIAGVLASIVPAGILALRIRLEERVLRAAFVAYVAYAARVRWRLVPGFW
jgi:protein-S-isoprenylcysteine O-methyltransferase Ste14